MALRFQWEPLKKLVKEPNLQELLREHWEDLAIHKDQMILDPDWDRYFAIEGAGFYRVWAARDGATLAGYVGWFLQPHIHYKSTRLAMEDLYLLSTPYRKGLAGVRMFKTALDALKELGVERVIVHSKVHYQAERGGLGPLFKRLGFVHMDELWSRML